MVGYFMVGPVAVFLVVMWFLQVLPRQSGRSDGLRRAIPVGAVLVALALGPVAAVVAAAVVGLALVGVASTF